MTDATVFGLPLLYLIGPLVVFGPILFFVAYSLGLGGIFRKSEGPAIAGDGAERRAHDGRVRAARDTAWFLGANVRRGRGLLSHVGQVVLFVPFLVFIGVLSNSPDHRLIEAEQALIKLSFSHAGQHVEECRRLSREELAALPPNMRAPMKCKRERWPVSVTLWLDGSQIYDVTAQPSGLSDDGPSVIYRTFRMPAGQHHLRVVLRDSRAPGAEPVDQTVRLDLAMGQVMAVEFDGKTRQITTR